MTEALQPKSLTRSFVEGELALGFWSFAKKASGALDAFLILRAFSLWQLGVYHILLSLYGIASDFFHDVFSEVIGNDLARLAGAGEEAKAKRLFCEYAAFRMGMAVLPAAAFFFAAPWVAAFLGYGGEAAAALRIMAFLFIAEALIGLATLLLKLRLAFRVLAPRATIQKLLQFGILAGFFFFSRLDISTVFWAQLGGATGAFLVMLPAALRRTAPWRWVPAAREPMFLPAVRAYGKWAVPQAFLADLTGKARPWLIRLFVGTEAVGVFGVANTFLSAIKDLLPIRTPGSLVPRRIRDAGALDRFYRYGSKYYVWLAVGLCAGAAVAVPVAIGIFFPKFYPSVPLFWILLVSVPFFAFMKPMTFLLVAFRRQKFLFFQSALQTAIASALMLIFLPAAGVMGLAIAEALASIANVGVRYRYLVRQGVIGRFRFRSLFAFDDRDRAHAAALMRHLSFARSPRRDHQL
ncbi:MAG: hypothetical protein AAB533_00835 [Patescibacteria group bacterium]